MKSDDSHMKIYLAPFHSSFEGYGVGDCRSGFRNLSRALERGEWPYDLGDDPSFVSQRYFGGQLTWGICRQQIRNRLAPGDVVVFFSFRKRRANEATEYRFCGFATVERKVSQVDIWGNPTLRVYRKYLNLLIRRGKSALWEHHERGSPRRMWHKDWLWRLVDHRGLLKREFEALSGRDVISSAARVQGRSLQIAQNYVIFSNSIGATHIAGEPPVVAWCESAGRVEEWTRDEFSAGIRRLTVECARRHGGRGALRTKNLQRPHPCDQWEVGASAGREWRDELWRFVSRSGYRSQGSARTPDAVGKGNDSV